MNDIAKLISGFRDFRWENFTANRSRFQDLVSRGQSPRIMVIACSDSRLALLRQCRLSHKRKHAT
jgi:carbonic anhydrase